MGNFVFESDYETLLKYCGGDEDLAMDAVLYLLTYKDRSIRRAVSDLLESKKKSCDVIDKCVIQSFKDTNLIYTMPNIDIYVIISLAKAILGLSARRIIVIYCRFFAGYTLKETGKILGICTEQARQIECKALRLLRRPKTLKKLDGFIEQEFSILGHDCYSINHFLNRLISISGIDKNSANNIIKEINEILSNNKKAEEGIIEFAVSEEDKEKLFMNYVYKDIPGFIDNSPLKLPKPLYNSLRIVLSVFKERRYKNLDRFALIFFLLTEYKGVNYTGIQMLLNELNSFVQEYMYHSPDSINKRDKNWLYSYYRLKRNNFRMSEVFIVNQYIPDELKTILDCTSYCKHYAAFGSIFSDYDDILIYALYTGKSAQEYDKIQKHKSLFNYITTVIYHELDVSLWYVYNKELENQNKLYKIYESLDHITLRNYRFPVYKKQMDPERVKRDTINFIYTKNKNRYPLYLAIKPKTYVQEVMRYYYDSLVFLSKVGETKVLSDIGIPMDKIESCTSNLSVSVITSTFTWIKSVVPSIRFSKSDFYTLYNLDDDTLSYKLDIIIDYIKIIVKLDSKKDANIIGRTIDLIREIIIK